MGFFLEEMSILRCFYVFIQLGLLQLLLFLKSVASTSIFEMLIYSSYPSACYILLAVCSSIEF